MATTVLPIHMCYKDIWLLHVPCLVIQCNVWIHSFYQRHNHHHPFALFGDEFFRWVMGPLLVCWGLWNAPVLLDVVNFITWIISTITYRNPKHKMKHCCVKISQFSNASMFNMKCWLYDGNNPDLLKLSNYQSCPTSSHLRLWYGMAW